MRLDVLQVFRCAAIDVARQELHARAVMVAEARGKSLNTWVSEVIEKNLAA